MLYLCLLITRQKLDKAMQDKTDGEHGFQTNKAKTFTYNNQLTFVLCRNVIALWELKMQVLSNSSFHHI